VAHEGDPEALLEDCLQAAKATADSLRESGQAWSPFLRAKLGAVGGGGGERQTRNLRVTTDQEGNEEQGLYFSLGPAVELLQSALAVVFGQPAAS